MIKTGDYVEVLPEAGNTGVVDGEQGVVTDGDDQYELLVLFPANQDLWDEDDGYGWATTSKEVKLIYRPRGKR